MEPPSPPRRRRRLLRWCIGSVAALALIAELILRLGYGLGDPPLFDRDPKIEYLYKPSRHYRYHHHDVSFNAYSMRSPDFPAKKPDPAELRVMVIGDSIVTGGGRIDQTELATEILRTTLAAELHRPVIVGNIAAGSWGPPNQLAYVQRFGLFDADVVILVLNSGDADDVPGLEPIGAAWPQHTPVLALQEPVRRVIERTAPGVAASLGLLDRAPAPPYEQRVVDVERAIRDLAQTARGAGARIGAVQFWKLSELRAVPDTGHEIIWRDLELAGIPIRQSGGPAATDHQFEADPQLFLPGDDVHPSAAGQRRLAEVLQAAVLDLLAPPASENR